MTEVHSLNWGDYPADGGPSPLESMIADAENAKKQIVRRDVVDIQLPDNISGEDPGANV